MPLIVLGVGNLKTTTEDRPARCPYCGSQVFQRWGTGQKEIQDVTMEIAVYYRYRCNQCEHTFRYYPPGIDKTKLTQRIRNLAAMSWALGLSSREVVDVFDELGIEMSQMTVWRDGHELVNRYKDSTDPYKPARYLIDKLFVKNRSRGVGTTIVLDLGEGKTAVLGKIDEVDPRKVFHWLEPFIKDLDIQAELHGTDMLDHYEPPSSG
ncbi:MAG TPA: hypothetical protein VMS73_00985 [Anaerolineaceae bacterium]|nr:hypothetical protein [Anaerolineaceae bacterium]